MRASILRSLAMAYGLLLLAPPCPAKTSGGGSPDSIRSRADLVAFRLTDPALFSRLDANLPVHAYRLAPAAPPDSGQGHVASLRAYEKGAELAGRPRKALARMWEILAGCPWVRAGGWSARSSPSVGFHWGSDSLGVDLLLSVQEMAATLFGPDQGTLRAKVPEEFRTDLAWCVWAIDPTNPEALPLIQSDMRRRGRNPAEAPPGDIAFLQGVSPPPASDLPGLSTNYDEAPALVSQTQPVYTEMAKEAQIEGVVLLRVLVGRDGRVKGVKVVRSVHYLDASATQAVSKWVYKPALLGGAPVEAWIDVPVEFKLP